MGLSTTFFADHGAAHGAVMLGENLDDAVDVVAGLLQRSRREIASAARLRSNPDRSWSYGWGDLSNSDSRHDYLTRNAIQAIALWACSTTRFGVDQQLSFRRLDVTIDILWGRRAVKVQRCPQQDDGPASNLWSDAMPYPLGHLLDMADFPEWGRHAGDDWGQGFSAFLPRVSESLDSDPSALLIACDWLEDQGGRLSQIGERLRSQVLRVVNDGLILSFDFDQEAMK